MSKITTFRIPPCVKKKDKFFHIEKLVLRVFSLKLEEMKLYNLELFLYRNEHHCDVELPGPPKIGDLLQLI